MKIIPNFKFTPILGWSVSRYETFRNCKRAYFYSYYGKFDEQIPNDVITSLKKLTSIPLEKGNITHDVIRDILIRYSKNSSEIDRVKLFTYIYKMIKSYCKGKVFSEVYYQQLPKVDFEQLFTEIKQAIVNFFNSNRFSWLLENALDSSADWVIEPGGFGECRFNDLKAYCKVDFLLPIKNQYYIFDWKTGKYSAERHRKQMLAYTLWTRSTFAINPQDINPILAFLDPTYQEIGEAFSTKELDELNDQILQESQEMYSYCSNVQDNIPLAKNKFPQTSNYIICSFCNYRKLCHLSNL